MKSTGIVRKVDELGRIVLPIELRRTLEIAERDSLEIYVDGSFRADTGEYSYGMVVLQEGEELCFQEKFSDPEAAAMRNALSLRWL